MYILRKTIRGAPHHALNAYKTTTHEKIIQIPLSNHANPSSLASIFPGNHLRDIKQLLQLDNQLPLILTNITSEEFLERVDTLPADERV
jgi:hypothetical protein